MFQVTDIDIYSPLNLSLIHIYTEPGNVKGFYKKLNEDLNKEIKVVADELAKRCV